MDKAAWFGGALGPVQTLAAATCAVGLSVVASGPAAATPAYAFQQALAVPGVATFSGYDAAAFDPLTQLYYLTDRSNNGIDVYF